jgi:phosphomannomutase
MYGSQIERLKRDSKELKHYMYRMEKRGNYHILHKLRVKYDYLNSRINDIEQELLAA